MLRTFAFLGVVFAAAVSPAIADDVAVKGFYLESRTCQVYTGPCFANAEFGLTGKDAIMAWKVDEGVRDGVSLAGLSVVAVIHASDTLASAGIGDAKEVKSVLLVDDKADPAQHAALVAFAREQTGKAGQSVVRVQSMPIHMALDRATLEGRLEAGKVVKMATRKARPGDCICMNEVAYYPPLASVESCVPAVSKEAEFSGRGLGTQWSVPDSRGAYMGLFEFPAAPRLADRAAVN